MTHSANQTSWHRLPKMAVTATALLMTALGAAPAASASTHRTTYAMHYKAAGRTVSLTETGSTLLEPLFQIWTSAYQKKFPNVNIVPSGAARVRVLATPAPEWWTSGLRRLLVGLGPGTVPRPPGHRARYFLADGQLQHRRLGRQCPFEVERKTAVGDLPGKGNHLGHPSDQSAQPGRKVAVGEDRRSPPCR